MNSYLQLICLLYSFLFGYSLYYLCKFNIRIIRKLGLLFKIIISVLFINNVSLFYIIVLYKLNYGILHYYFIIMIILGFMLCCVKKRKDV